MAIVIKTKYNVVEISIEDNDVVIKSGGMPIASIAIVDLLTFIDESWAIEKDGEEDVK